MKGIRICCDGEESLEKELAQLAFPKKNQVKKRKNNLLLNFKQLVSIASNKL